MLDASTEPIIDRMSAPPSTFMGRLVRRVRMFISSVRLRLVWWFVVVLAVATVGSVLVARQILLSRLDARIDSELIQEIREVELLAEGNDPETGEPFETRVDRIFEVALDRNVPARAEIIITFVGGDLVDSTGGERAPPIEALPLATWAALEEPERGRLSDVDGRTVEYLAVPFLVGGEQAGVYVVAIDRDLESADTDAASIATAAVGLAMLLIGSVLAVRLAGSILRPIREVRETAQSITETDLSQRIEISGHDEEAQLADTFNDMLDRLDASFAPQRRFHR